MDPLLETIRLLMMEKGFDAQESESLIQDIQSEWGVKKYGLVWENKIETVSEQLKTHLPYLTEVETKRLLNDKDSTLHHLLMEGDNLEALTLLQTLYKGAVKICYIDPPYNRGKNDFIYNDVFIDKEDRYRHSKWLSFMEKRLTLAYELLTKDGVMFISIGEDEFAPLKLLCDSIFNEENVEIMVWNKIATDGSAGQGKMKITHRFRLDHEYLIVAYKNKTLTKFNKPLVKKSYKNEYNNVDNDPRGEWVSCELCKSEAKSNANGKNYYTVTTPSGRVLNRQWHLSESEFHELDLDNRIYWGKGNTVPRLKKFVNEAQPTTPTSVISGITQTDGENDLSRIFGCKVFSYPKPVELVKWILKIASQEEDIILDFFAGSGTTGQAVIELNHEDGGNRKCILCTNNEVSKNQQKEYFSLTDDQFNEFVKTEEYKRRTKELSFQALGICQAITYKRLQYVINGYTSSKGKTVDGIPANLHYYKINLIPKAHNLTDNAMEYLSKGVELICIKENVFDLIKEVDYVIATSAEKAVLIYLQPFALGYEVMNIAKTLDPFPQAQKIIYATMTQVSIDGIEVKEYPQEILEQINRIQQRLKQWERGSNGE